MPKPRSAPPEGFPGMMMNDDDDDNSALWVKQCNYKRSKVRKSLLK